MSKFRAKIGTDDIVDSDVILGVLPMVAFSRFGEEKTYHCKAQELRLNAKIAIDKTINAKLGRLSFFRGRFKEKPYDENLMLHIKKEEHQKYADSMIDHYGVERDRDGKINAFELAMKMDLDIETGAFDRNHSILGAMVFEEKDLRLYDGSSRKWNKKHVMPIVNACAAMARPLEEDGYFGLNSKDDLCDTITTLLRDEPKGLPCWK